jgi:hypothetical protein
LGSKSERIAVSCLCAAAQQNDPFFFVRRRAAAKMPLFYVEGRMSVTNDHLNLPKRKHQKYGVDTLLHWALRHAIEDREAILQQHADGVRVFTHSERASATLLIQVFTARCGSERPLVANGEVMRMACQYAEKNRADFLAARNYEHGITKSLSLNEQYERLKQLRALHRKCWALKVLTQEKESLAR